MEDVEDIHTPFKKPLEFFYIHQFVPWRLKKKQNKKKQKKNDNLQENESK